MQRYNTIATGNRRGLYKCFTTFETFKECLYFDLQSFRVSFANPIFEEYRII